MTKEKAPRRILGAVLLLGAFVAAGVVRPDRAGGQPVEPGDRTVSKTGFVLEVEGLTPAGVLSIEPFTIATEVLTYRDGTDPIEHKLPGHTNYGTITLERSAGANDQMWSWYMSAVNGPVVRRQGRVTVLTTEGTPQVSYEFYDAWPCRWKGPALGDTGSSLATEEITLCVERIVRQ
jgi:phage tail-like protein